MNIAIAFYIIAALLGIFLAIQSSFWIIPVGIICGYRLPYTGGPMPISWTPFGELFSGLFMGMIIIVLSFFIQTGNVKAMRSGLVFQSLLLLASLIWLIISVTVLKTKKVQKNFTYFIR